MHRMIALLAVVCSSSLALADSAPANIDPEMPAVAARPLPAPSPADRPSYVAPALGIASFQGATGPAAGIEAGIGMRSSPFGLHVAATTASVTTGFLFGADGSAGAVRGGPELHLCGEHACAYFGVDAGYAWVHTSSGGFLSDAGFSNSGKTYGPHFAFEIGHSTLRFRLTADAFMGDVAGFESSGALAIHW